MKIITISLVLLCLLKNADAQVTGNIQTANSLPAVSANVLLLKSDDSSLAKAALSKADGIFLLENILPGSYILRISSAGFHEWNSPVFEISDTATKKDFGIILLKENAKELGVVVLRADKPLYQQKPEGTVVNVENSLLTKGSNALQVLERSPGVVINRRDNSIELNGKSGVIVMLNGKPMRMSIEQVVNLLGGMSADDISTIELLTTPPAGYDSDGSAGLINIVLKKNKRQGTSGSLSLTTGYGYGEKGTGSLTLSHNKKNINLYGSYSFSHDKTYSNMYVASSQNMPFLGGDVYVTGWFTTKALRDNHDANFGVDYKVNSKTTIGANITYNNSKASGKTLTDAGYNVLPDSLLQFNGNNKGTNRWNNLASSMYVEKAIRPGEKIILDANYLWFNNKAGSYVQSSFINKHGEQAGSDEILFSPGQQSFANTNIQVGVLKPDYTKQLTKKTKLETGIKNTYTQTSSVSWIESLINGTWTTNPQTTNNIVMKETIAAAYASIASQLNESTNLTIGTRYEYSYTNMDNSKTGTNIANRKLGALFPVVFFSKKLSDKSELQFSYTKRISRPSYNDLASYVGYSDPTAVYTGNPFLKPTITNNLKLGYNYKNYSFSLLFSRDKDAITRYQLTESPDKDMLFISPKNLLWQNNITFQTNLPFKINNAWTMNYGFVGGFHQYKGDFTKTPFEKSYFGYSFNSTQTFKLPANFSAELSGVYHSTSYDGTKRVKGFGSINAGIKKELNGDKGSFQFSISDILSSERYLIDYGTITEEAFNIKSHVAFYPESAHQSILKLTYSRSFGNNKTKATRNTNTNDEQDRIRKD